MPSDLEVFTSLKVHPGWVKMVEWLHKKANLTPNKLKVLTDTEMRLAVMEADIYLGVIRHVDDEIKRFMEESEKKKGEIPKSG